MADISDADFVAAESGGNDARALLRDQAGTAFRHFRLGRGRLCELRGGTPCRGKKREPG
jgi:hypothetical protein